MREKVGTYAEAGFPNYDDKDGDGYPDKVDVSRRLFLNANNGPDHYETFRPNLMLRSFQPSRTKRRNMSPTKPIRMCRRSSRNRHHPEERRQRRARR